MLPGPVIPSLSSSRTGNHVPKHVGHHTMKRVDQFSPNYARWRGILQLGLEGVLSGIWITSGRWWKGGRFRWSPRKQKRQLLQHSQLVLALHSLDRIRICDKNHAQVNTKLKTLKAHPNSPLAKMMPKIMEDKKWQLAYCRGEITREELEAKGVKLAKRV